MNETVLITGGAGYLGSSLVRILLRENYNVIVLDTLLFGGEALLEICFHPNFKLVRGDIRDSNTLKSVFKNYKLSSVIHLAAIVGDPACAKQPELARSVNWDASLMLLDYSLKHNVERFVFASTCSNYGKMAIADTYLTETSPLAPVSLYAELKVQFENVLLNELEKKNNFCPTSLRFATIYGASPRMRFDLTVNEFTKELALGRELEVYGKQFWRPYCHVFDFARAITLVLKCKKEKIAYNVFNVGNTSENYQKEMIIDEIKKIIKNTNIKYVNKDEDPRDYQVSFEKIKNELGFITTKKVPDGIKEIEYLVRNKIISFPDDRKYRNS